MSDYSFMKSGMSGNALSSMNSGMYNEFNLKLTCMLRILMEKSMEMAGEYVEHSKRNTITCDDMIYALQYEAHEFMSLENEEELSQKVNEYITQSDTMTLFESILSSVESNESVLNDEDNDDASVYSDEDDGESVTGTISCSSSEDYGSESEEEDEFKESKCECEMCIKMNQYHREWDSWQPTDDLDCMFKRSVDKAIEKMRETD